MDRAANVLMGGMANRPVGVFVEIAVGPVFIRGEQADLVGNDLADEIPKGDVIAFFEDAGDDIAFALDRTHVGCLTGRFALPAGNGVIPALIQALAAENVSSTSTIPISFRNFFSCKPARMRWHMYQAVR